MPDATTDIDFGLTRIDDLESRKGQDLTVMGLVVDFMAPAPTRGTDWVCTFSIADLYSRPDGQRVRFFARRQDLPNVQSIGDVVLLRHIQLKEYRGYDVLLSNWNTQWTVFLHGSTLRSRPSAGDRRLDPIRSKSAPVSSTAEMNYAFELCSSRDQTGFAEPSPLTKLPSQGLPSLTKKEKFSLISGVAAGTYYDLVGEIVKLYPSNERLDLSVTDYTENNLLFNYEPPDLETNADVRDGDPCGYISAKQRRMWRGPSGKRTITVTLFSPHSYYAQQKLRERDYVLLRNVHVKLGRDGSGSSGKLEGALHTDKKYPQKIEVEALNIKDDPKDYLKQLLKRKREYERSAKANSRSNLGSKRASEEVDGCKPSKLNQRRKKAKASAMKNRASKEVDLPRWEEPATKGPGFHAVQRRKHNVPQENVLCKRHSQPVRTVAAITSTHQMHSHSTPGGIRCTLPFQNLSSRAVLRVIDFKPSKLENFAVRQRLCDYDETSESENEADEEISRSIGFLSKTDDWPDDQISDFDDDLQNRDKGQYQWIWRFALLLEDASNAGPKVSSDRLVVYVEGKDADFLLDMDPTDLRQDQAALAQLREKLFILWGDLEECKAQNAQYYPQEDPLRGNSRHQRALVGTNGNANPSKLSNDDFSDDRDGKSTSNGRFSGHHQHIPAQPSCMAFSCCIKEYGIKERGEWKRRFRLSETTIR